MWWPLSNIRRAWAMDIESIVAFGLLIALESSMEQPYPFSPKDHFHRPRRAPLSPNYDCTRTSADQTSPRSRSWTSLMVTCPTLGGRRRMAWTSAVGGRGKKGIAPRDVSREEEGSLVTLAMHAECRAQVCEGRASENGLLSEQGIQDSATTSSKPDVK
jgi:hypothetical protein